MFNVAAHTMGRSRPTKREIVNGVTAGSGENGKILRNDICQLEYAVRARVLHTMAM